MTQVSVFLPVYNGAATIGRALSSLIAQTLTDFEVLVVDDGSTDQTAQIVREFAKKDERIRLVSLPENSGVSHARNVALEQARGLWIALLDADDWYEFDRLFRLVEAATSLTADVVFDNLLLADRDGHVFAHAEFLAEDSAPEKIGPRDLFERDTPFSDFAVGYAKPLCRASFLKENGLAYDERYSLGEDFLFLAQALLKGAVAYVLPYAGYFYTYAKPTPFARMNLARKGARNYQQVVQANEDLIASFAALVSAEVLQEMVQRKKSFEKLDEVRRVKYLFYNGHKAQVFLGMLKRPDLLLFAIRVALLKFRLSEIR